ncbi:hypothetical protein RB213_014562, partial [Colletotrichum asianum]
PDASRNWSAKEGSRRRSFSIIISTSHLALISGRQDVKGPTQSRLVGVAGDHECHWDGLSLSVMKLQNCQSQAKQAQVWS